MKLKTTLALALLAGAAAALYRVGPQLPFSLWSSPEPPPRDLAGTREALAELRPEQIVHVAIRKDGQDLAVLDRTPAGGWTVSGNWPGNPAEIRPVIELLAGLHSRFLAEAAERADDPALFGLGRPALTVEIRSRDLVAGKRRHVLTLGEPRGGDYRFVRPTFARLDDRPEVLRLAPGLAAELARPADHYRLRRLFPAERTVRLNNPQERIERLDARELLIRQDGSPTLRLAKGRDGWELREPTRDHLDPDNAERLLWAVAELWAEQFVTVEPSLVATALVPPASLLLPLAGLACLSPTAARHRAGLDKPTQSLQVTRPDGTVTTLLFGNRSRGDGPPPIPPRPGMPPPPSDTYRYARLEGSDLIFEVQDGRLNDVFQTVDALRDNRLARFNTDDAERIEVREGGQAVVLVKEKKDTWKMTSPRDAGADNDKVRDLLQKLSGLEAPDRDLLTPARRAALAAGAVAALAVPSPAAVALAGASVYPDSAFGLGRPSGEVTVVLLEKARPEDRDRSKERTLTLRLGKPGWGGNRVYLQAAGWPRIDAMEDSLSALLDKPAVSYRGKQLFDFAAKDVARLEARRVALPAARRALGGLAGATAAVVGERAADVVLQRSADEWKLTRPVTTAADAIKVNDLLDALGRLKAMTFVADDVPQKELGPRYGLAPPALEVTVTFADAAKPPRTLSVGERRVLEQGWFARLGDSRDVFALPADLHDRLEQSALAYLPSTLWQIAADDEIVKFRIAKAGQDEYQLVRKGDDWQVAGPFTVAAPSQVVERLSSALLSPRAEEYRSFAGGDLSAFGLARPAVKLTLTTKKGKEHSLWLGKHTSSGKSGRYARQGSGPQVFVVSDTLAKAADQSALDFLDRNLLTFDSSAATSIVRRRGADILELVKQDDAWKLTKPAEQPADERKIPDLLRQLGSLRAERLVAYKPKDLKPFGLEKPEATLTVKLPGEGKQAEHVLLLGREEGAGARLAMVKGAPAVAVLSAAVARQLLAPDLAFRSHDLARVPDADTMKLEAGQRKVTFARPEGTWKVSQPVSADADHDALESYLGGLSRLRADELVAEKPPLAKLVACGLEKPVARWQIYQGDELKLDLAVGAPAPDGKRRYARLADRDLVFLLDEKLSAQATAEYRPRALWKDGVDPAQVEAVRFGYKKDPFELKKEGGDWQVVGKPGVKLDQSAVSDALSALRELKLERYVRDDAAQLKLYGLDPPELVLEVTTPSGKHTLLLGGLEGGSKRRYARLRDSKYKDVFVLDESASGKLFRDLQALTKPAAGGRKEGL
jgi:hypothetical protein